MVLLILIGNAGWRLGGLEDLCSVWNLKVEMTVKHLDGGVQYSVGYGI